MPDWGDRRDALVDRLTERTDLDPHTEAAMRAVPRHTFLPADRRDRAYHDQPLPIGGGQTISAPHIVAAMTDLLDLEPDQEVLEIGTGCGYHAAVTAEVVGPEHVFSVEYDERLAERARENLAAAGYGPVSVRAGDGKRGWPAHAPYDRAYLTCAAPDFPDAVVEQVRSGGVLVGPLGRNRQTLVRAEKGPAGDLERDSHGSVRFVPLR